MMPGISSENQDQPSPISVLEPLFRDDNAAQESLDSTKAGYMGSYFASCYENHYFGDFSFPMPVLIMT